MDSKSKPENSLDKLSKVLPDNLDRRKFIGSTVGASIAAIAGCMGDENNGSDTSNTSNGTEGDVMSINTNWPVDWTLSTNNVVTTIAENEGFLEDFGASINEVTRGYGSGDTTREVGTGQEDARLGKASIIPVLNGFDAGQDVKIFATDRPRAAHVLVYRTDSIEDPTSFSNKTIGGSDALENTYTMYEYALGMGEDGNLSNDYTTIEQSAYISTLTNGDVDAVWDQTDTYAEFAPQVGVDIEAEVLYNHAPIVEDVLITNGDWVEQDENIEFISRCLSAHSHAAKFCLLNPEETIDILREEINPDLQIVDRESLQTGMKTGFMTLALTENVKNEGYNFLNEEAINTAIDWTVDTYGIEQIDYEDIVLTEAQERADLATYDDDEWEQIVEYVGEWENLLE